jgi:hypothetical protein
MNLTPEFTDLLKDYTRLDYRQSVLKAHRQRLKNGFSFSEQARYEKLKAIPMPLQMAA